MKPLKRKPTKVMILISGDDCLSTQAPEGWTLVDGRLMRELECSDFNQAKQIVDKISEIAERLNHHPELHFGWGYVVIECYTHDENAVTQSDFKLANKIEEAI